MLLTISRCGDLRRSTLLMTKRQDLYLQRRSRPEHSDQRQPNQAENISHQSRASPDSTSLASWIEFPTMTGMWRSLRRSASLLGTRGQAGYLITTEDEMMPPPAQRQLVTRVSSRLLLPFWRIARFAAVRKRLPLSAYDPRHRRIQAFGTGRAIPASRQRALFQ